MRNEMDRKRKKNANKMKIKQAKDDEKKSHEKLKMWIQQH
jgi:hypothetical protein